jgi:SOS-response transcriptional repressor LexA
MEAPSEEDKEEIMGVCIGDPLTRRQAEVLEYIRRHTRENGRPPTVREIGRGWASSTATVSRRSSRR